MNNVLMKLEELITKELEKVVNKGDMTPSELEISKKAVCLLKELKEYEVMDMEVSDNGYSDRRGRSSVTGRYMSRRDGSYSGTDAVPYYESYSTTPMPSMYYTYGSNRNMNEGYSGHSIKDRMVSRLEGMMGEAQNDYERRTIEDFIHRLESDK